MKLYEDWKGYLPNYDVLPFETPAAIGMTDTLPLDANVETYYRKIIELCQSRGIPLHVVVSPCFVTEEEIPRYNRAQEIAAEYGVSFTNFNTPEFLELLDFDYAKDMGVGNHLNYRASIRFTRALGDLFVSAYDLPDRRGDPRYASWERSAAYYRRDLTNQQLREEMQLEPYLARLAQDPDYTAVISITGYCADYFDQLVSLLEPLGVDNLFFPHAMNGTWAVRGGEMLSCWEPGMRYPYVQLDSHTVTFDGEHRPIVDQSPILLTAKGLNIVVYDHVTGTIADTVGFDALGGFTAVR